jgi:hypothetical protein
MPTNSEFYSSLTLAASQPPMPHDPIVVSAPSPRIPVVAYGPSLHVLVSASAPFPQSVAADAAPSLLVLVAQMIVHLQHLVNVVAVVIHPATLHLEQSAC